MDAIERLNLDGHILTVAVEYGLPSVLISILGDVGQNHGIENNGLIKVG
jgi:hypothetical protein